MHALPPETYTNARRRLERLLILTCASLDETLQRSGSELAGEVSAWFDLVANLNAQHFIDEGTPFWWFNLRQCCAAAMDGSKQTGEYARNMLLAAFDSFFGQLPHGTTVRPQANGNPDIVLPKIGLTIPAALKPTSITRLGVNTIGIGTDDALISVDLDGNRCGFATPRIPIPGHEGQHLLIAATKALLGDDPRANLAPTSFDSVAFADLLGQSLNLVQSVSPKLYDEIRTANAWFVPITTDDIRIHRSYTREDLAGVMFLSEALDHVLLAEAIIHEFYHGVLNSIITTDPVFEDSDSSEILYSPWRDDPRPVRGLLHAIYVFSGVSKFYALSNAELAGNGHGETVRLRRSKLHYQLRYALAQVPMNKLTPLGRRIISDITSQVENERDADNLFDPGVTATLESHLSAWRARNPQLRVGLPDCPLI